MGEILWLLVNFFYYSLLYLTCNHRKILILWFLCPTFLSVQIRNSLLNVERVFLIAWGILVPKQIEALDRIDVNHWLSFVCVQVFIRLSLLHVVRECWFGCILSEHGILGRFARFLGHFRFALLFVGVLGWIVGFCLAQLSGARVVVASRVIHNLKVIEVGNVKIWD